MSRRVDHSSSSLAILASVLEPLEFVSGECSSNRRTIFSSEFNFLFRRAETCSVSTFFLSSECTGGPSLIYHPLGSSRLRNNSVSTEIVGNISSSKRDQGQSSYFAVCTLDGKLSLNTNHIQKSCFCKGLAAHTYFHYLYSIDEHLSCLDLVRFLSLIAWIPLTAN